MHMNSRNVPWISTTISGGIPASWCRPSTFWVINVSSLPRSWSVTSARCPALGSRAAPTIWSFCCQERRRVSGSAM